MKASASSRARAAQDRFKAERGRLAGDVVEDRSILGQQFTVAEDERRNIAFR